MSKKENAVDFNYPEAIAEELAAAETTAATATTTEKKEKVKKPRVVKVSFTATADIKAGETVEFDYELPMSTRCGAGVNAGIAIEDMSIEQLKIEYRNANSVLYKTKKAGRDCSKAHELFYKVVEAMTAKGVTPGQRAAAPVKVDAAVIANLISKGEVSIDDIQKMLDATAAK